MKRKPVAVRRHAESDGFIIVSALWILAALATLAMVYAVYIRNTAPTVRVNDDRLQTEALITAGLELTAYQLTNGLETSPTRGQFRVRLGRANISVEFHSEAGRIDINLAPPELIASLFVTLGAQPADAKEYTNRIIAWRTPVRTQIQDQDQDQDQDQEVSAYRTAGLTYKPRQAPFPNTLELWRVLGIPPPFVERALPYLTVYSGQAEIDVLAAAPEVLASLPGMDPERLQNLLTQRNILLAQGVTDPKVLQPTLVALGLTGVAMTDGSRTTRVVIRIEFDNGRRVLGNAVIAPLEKANEPYRVLFWRDDFDQLTPGDQS